MSATPKLTPRAEHVLMLAAADAKARGHDYVGTEHILMGMLRENEGLAAAMLESLGVAEKLPMLMDLAIGPKR